MEQKFYAVEYAGCWEIQSEPGYGGPNVLNAEDVGKEQAEINAKKIAWLLNREAAKGIVSPPRSGQTEVA